MNQITTYEQFQANELLKEINSDPKNAPLWHLDPVAHDRFMIRIHIEKMRNMPCVDSLMKYWWENIYDQYDTVNLNNIMKDQLQYFLGSREHMKKELRKFFNHYRTQLHLDEDGCEKEHISIRKGSMNKIYRYIDKYLDNELSPKDQIYLKDMYKKIYVDCDTYLGGIGDDYNDWISYKFMSLTLMKNIKMF